MRPDVAVPSDQALAVAHADALKRLIARATDTQRRRQLEEALAEVTRP